MGANYEHRVVQTRGMNYICRALWLAGKFRTANHNAANEQSMIYAWNLLYRIGPML